METYKAQPLEERKSRKLNFWDFTKDRLFWGALPILTGTAALVFGQLTKFKVFPLDGSPDILTHAYAKGMKLFSRKANIEVVEKLAKDVDSGKYMSDVFEAIGLPTPDKFRKWFYNFAKGTEVALPFSTYFLWHKKEANRLQLQEVDTKLKGLQDIKPSNAELAEQNEVMRRELAFAAQSQAAPAAESQTEGGASTWQQRTSSQKEAAGAIAPRGSYREEALKEPSAHASQR